MKELPIIITGGGIGGLSTAIALRQKGLNVKVYEKAEPLRGLGAGLVLAANAIKAYQEIGIEPQIAKIGQFIPLLKILNQHGRTLSQAASGLFAREKFGVSTFAVSRADLHEVLMSLLPEEIIETGKACKSYQEVNDGIEVYFEDGTSAKGSALIAADGIHSPIRKQLIPERPLRYSGYTCWRGITDGASTISQQEFISETWGPNGRFGIVPLTKDRIYWFATHDAKEGDPAMAAKKGQALMAYFGSYHSPIHQILAATEDEDILWNDIIDFKPLTQFAFGRTVLLGDAAHATTPNMGQGACMAIEDAAILANCISAHSDLPTAFKHFESKRLKRTAWIVQNSWRIGKLGQWNHPLSMSIRNSLMRLTPNSVQEKQFHQLFDIQLQ